MGGIEQGQAYQLHAFKAETTGFMVTVMVRVGLKEKRWGFDPEQAGMQNQRATVYPL